LTISPLPSFPSGRSRSSSEVKSARPDILIDEATSIPVELMEKLIFENIGGQELLLISRHNNLPGQKIAYQAISNLRDVDLRYSAENILFASETFKNYFKNFTILLESVVPQLGTLANPNQFVPNGYSSFSDGSITLEFLDLKSKDQVEIQTIFSTTLFDDTIY
jgi:hypothetical protein